MIYIYIYIIYIYIYIIYIYITSLYLIYLSIYLCAYESLLLTACVKKSLETYLMIFKLLISYETYN